MVITHSIVKSKMFLFFIATVYVSEISSPKWRGMLGVGSIVCLTLGINYMLAIGAVLPMYPGSWKIFAIACVAPQMMGNVCNY